MRECFYCHKVGHRIAVCPVLEGKRFKSQPAIRNVGMIKSMNFLRLWTVLSNRLFRVKVTLSEMDSVICTRYIWNPIYFLEMWKLMFVRSYRLQELVWLRQLLIFLSLLYLFLPIFGAPTAPRAFELLTGFKRSQFGTDLRQYLCISNSTAPSPSFSITPFIPSIFSLSWMGRCWFAKTNHMTIHPPCTDVKLKMEPNCLTLCIFWRKCTSQINFIIGNDVAGGRVFSLPRIKKKLKTSIENMVPKVFF